MRVVSLLAPLALLAWLLAPPRAGACTTVQVKTAKGAVYVGKGYDWSVGSGHVLFNKKGVAKRAALPDPTDKPAEWVSKHASITFNQYGRELPNGGMNDAGLMVEVMWLHETVFPPKDERPAVNELQWIQHQLDSHASVAEVVAHAGEVRPAAMYGKVHYLACDRGGACAAFEYLKGKLVITQGAALVVSTLTNSTYADSVKALRGFEGFGGKAPIPDGIASTARFARASRLARQATSEAPVLRTLAVLDAVRIAHNPTGNITQWQIVYDLEKRRVSWRTAADREIKSAALAEEAPGCEAPVTYLDINGAQGAKAKRWTVAANQALITASTATIKDKLPAGAMERLAGYPTKLPCVPARPQAEKKKGKKNP